MTDIKDSDICEVYQVFTDLLNKRVSQKRKDHNLSLSIYTVEMVSILAATNFQPFMKEMLDENFETLLSDCDIHFDMKKESAQDALQELSHLACVYVVEDHLNSNYTRIGLAIEKLRNSYFS